MPNIPRIMANIDEGHPDLMESEVFRRWQGGNVRRKIDPDFIKFTKGELEAGKILDGFIQSVRSDYTDIAETFML